MEDASSFDQMEFVKFLKGDFLKEALCMAQEGVGILEGGSLFAFFITIAKLRQLDRFVKNNWSNFANRA